MLDDKKQEDQKRKSADIEKIRKILGTPPKNLGDFSFQRAVDFKI